MPFAVQVIPNADLIVCFGGGHLLPQEIFDAIVDAKREDQFRPGMDRLILWDETTDVSNFNIKTLSDLKSAVEDAERQGLDAPIRFKSAMVCPSVMLEIWVKLYGALWQADGVETVRFQVFHELADALQWLERPDFSVPARPF